VVRAAVTSSPQISTFALYAARSLSLGASDLVIGGDIGVRSVASTSGAQLSIGASTTVDTRYSVYAPTVSVGSHATVGAVDTSSLQNQGGSTGTVSAFPASSMPSVPVPVAGTPGGPNLTVPAFTIFTINPGAYGAANIVGTVVLTPGTYSFTNMTLANAGHLWAQAGGVRIAIRDFLTTGTSATILPVFGQTAKDLTISVAGNDTATPAVSLGASSQFTGLLVAPHGTLSLAGGVNAVGALAAFDISAAQYVTTTFQDGFSPAAPGQQGQQLVQGYTPPIADAQLVGPVPESTVLKMALGLPVQNAQALQTFIQAVNDPNSPSFRAYLTPQAFAAQYAPTQASYAAVSSFAQAHGLTVTSTYSNNLLLDVSGTAAQLAQAFHVNLGNYVAADGTTFYAPDRAPSLDLTTSVTGVAGIDNRSLTAKHSSGTGVGGALTASDLRRAYAPCTSLTGSSQSIGIFSRGTFDPKDITGYEAASFKNYPVALGGNPNVPVIHRSVSGYTGPSSDFKYETTLDIEMAIALAPKLQEVDVFESDPNSATFDVDTLTLMASATYGHILQFSSSFGFSVYKMTSTPLQALQSMGQAMFVASGDGGAYAPVGAGTPGGNEPYTMVGGTLLTFSGSSYVSEVGWPLSGGGNQGFAIPSYQSALLSAEAVPFANGASRTFENMPDVSMVADNIQVQWQGSTLGGGGGTSASTPLWASFLALANDQLSTTSGTAPPAGFPNPTLYGIAQTMYGTCFHDITSGNTSNSSNSAGYTAGPGYDLVTGIGSPQCELIYQLGSTTPLTPVCPAGQGMCGGACQSFQSDSNNCGACGHSCYPGTCSAGKCNPWTIASQAEITKLATDGSYVAWIGQDFNGPLGLFAAPVAGTAGGNTPQLLAQGGPSTITVGNGQVAWVSYNAGTTTYSYLDEGTSSVVNVPNNLYSGGGGAFAMGIDGYSYIYIADTGGSSSSFKVYECNVASSTFVGCSVNTTVQSASGPTAFSFNTGGIERDTLLVGGGTSLSEVNLLNGSSGTVSNQGMGLISLTADTQNAYWVRLDTFTDQDPPATVSLLGAPLSNLSAVTTFATNVGVGLLFAPTGVVTSDDSNVYFAAVSLPATSTGPSYITSYPKSGGSPTPIYSTSNWITAISAANGGLYWVEIVNNDANPKAWVMGLRYP
jgi:hypothetical protein